MASVNIDCFQLNMGVCLLSSALANEYVIQIPMVEKKKAGACDHQIGIWYAKYSNHTNGSSLQEVLEA
jgi:hypothetical protein